MGLEKHFFFNESYILLFFNFFMKLTFRLLFDNLESFGLEVFHQDELLLGRGEVAVGEGQGFEAQLGTQLLKSRNQEVVGLTLLIERLHLETMSQACCYLPQNLTSSLKPDCSFL